MVSRLITSWRKIKGQHDEGQRRKIFVSETLGPVAPHRVALNLSPSIYVDIFPGLRSATVQVRSSLPHEEMQHTFVQVQLEYGFDFRCKIPWLFFSRKPPVLTSINCRKSIDHQPRNNVYERLLTTNFQDDGKGGLSLRGVAVTTETATTAITAKTVKTVTIASLSCFL